LKRLASAICSWQKIISIVLFQHLPYGKIVPTLKALVKGKQIKGNYFKRLVVFKKKKTVFNQKGYWSSRK
jgi:hypothetical protein